MAALLVPKSKATGWKLKCFHYLNINQYTFILTVIYFLKCYNQTVFSHSSKCKCIRIHLLKLMQINGRNLLSQEWVLVWHETSEESSGVKNIPLWRLRHWVCCTIIDLQSDTEAWSCASCTWNPLVLFLLFSWFFLVDSSVLAHVNYPLLLIYSSLRDQWI